MSLRRLRKAPERPRPAPAEDSGKIAETVHPHLKASHRKAGVRSNGRLLAPLNRHQERP
jgi:hypothetical protein